MEYQNRYYQNEAFDATVDGLMRGVNPIISLATGTGKSVVQKDLCEWIFKTYPGTRVMCLTHEKNLIMQNYSKMPRTMNAGVYSAGAKIRNVHNRIIFAGIQSIYKKANLFAPVGILIIDEVQLLNPKDDTMYMTFINGLREHNPHMLVIGLSATPFRSKEGSLTSCTFLDEIVYEYSIADGVRDGYLSPLKSKRGVVEANRSSVKITAGEFNKGDAAREFDRNTITIQAVAEIKEYLKTRNRGIVFCSSVDHANHVSDYMQDIPHAVISSKHDEDHNDLSILQHKHGALKLLINVNKLTVGYDDPMVDLIAVLRMTQSPVLYCQILGRGTRPVYADGFNLDTKEGRFAAMAAGPKPNGCLILDYGQNVETHGPVDKIKIEKKYNASSGELEDTISIQPTKMCPECRCDNHIQARTCPECGYDYPQEVKHARLASEAAILSADIEPEWFDVSSMRIDRHKKAGSPDSIKVTYIVGMGVKREWVSIENPRAIKFADKWWDKRGVGNRPLSVDEALSRRDDFKTPARIAVVPDGKYERICDYDDGEAVIINDKKTHAYYIDDIDIPF